MSCSIVGVVVTGCLALSPRPSGQEAAAVFAVAPHVEPVQEFKVPEGWKYIGAIHGEVLGSWYPFRRWYLNPYQYPDRAYVGDGVYIGAGFGLHQRTGTLGRQRGGRFGY